MPLCIKNDLSIYFGVFTVRDELTVTAHLKSLSAQSPSTEWSHKRDVYH